MSFGNVQDQHNGAQNVRYTNTIDFADATGMQIIWDKTAVVVLFDISLSLRLSSLFILFMQTEGNNLLYDIESFARGVPTLSNEKIDRWTAKFPFTDDRHF